MATTDAYRRLLDGEITPNAYGEAIRQHVRDELDTAEHPSRRSTAALWIGCVVSASRRIGVHALGR